MACEVITESAEITIAVAVCISELNSAFRAGERIEMRLEVHSIA